MKGKGLHEDAKGSLYSLSDPRLGYRTTGRLLCVQLFPVFAKLLVISTHAGAKSGVIWTLATMWGSIEPGYWTSTVENREH